MQNPLTTTHMEEDWIKSAMSVCGLSLNQRSKLLSPPPTKNVVVIPQASLLQEGDSAGSSPEEGDIISKSSNSKSSNISEIEESDLSHPEQSKPEHESPSSGHLWAENNVDKNKMASPTNHRDIRIQSDIRIHSDFGTVTASMPSDLKRTLELGVGTNFSKRLSGLGSSTLESQTWNKPRSVGRGVAGAGACINPRTRRDYLNDVFKVGTFSNTRKLDNVDLDVRLAVRQQFYDQWARPKRGRYINFENRLLRKKHPDDFVSRNAVKVKEFRKARSKLDDFLNNENRSSDSYKPVSSVEIKVSKTADSKSNEKSQKVPYSAKREYRKQNSAESEAEVDKDAMTLTFGDIEETMKSMENKMNERRGLVSHSFLEPFTFDRRTDNVPMVVAYRGAYDVASSRQSECRTNPSLNRQDDEKILRETGNTPSRYPWNKYHIFHFPVKYSQSNFTKQILSGKREKEVNNENSHLLKMPLIPSKRSPIFSEDDNLKLSGSRTDEKFRKYKKSQGTIRDGQSLENGVIVDSNVVGGTSYNSIGYRCGQQEKLRTGEMISRSSVKNKSDNVTKSRSSAIWQDSSNDVASLMVRGETPKLFIES